MIRGPLLVLLWHDALLPLLWYHRGRGVVVVVSRARDGQYLVDQAHRLGYRTVEGSSHRGGVQAMRGALRALNEGAIVAITPDGPRGPRRVIKPGGLAAAQAAGGAGHSTARRGQAVPPPGFVGPFPGAVADRAGANRLWARVRGGARANAGWLRRWRAPRATWRCSKRRLHGPG